VTLQNERKSRLTGALLIVVAATAFSGKGVIIKLAYRYGVDAVTLLALRMIFAAPLFVLLAAWGARGSTAEPISRVDWRNVAVLGLLGYYLASYFDFLGLQYISASLERLLLFVHPTFVVLMAAVIFKRRITSRDVVAIVLSYLGVALVFGHDLATQPGNVALGSFWVLLSALLYAAYLLGSGRVIGRVGSLRFACYAGLVSCVAVVAHFLVTRDFSLTLSQPAEVYWLGLLMAVVSTVLPIVLTAEGIRRIGASHASIIGSEGPISTIVLAAIFLGEHITFIQFAGAAFVLAGVLAISLQKKPAKP
jgi:drug/metabolite transporter (DMT)-like permease